MASRKMVRLSSAFRCVQPFYTMQVWLHDEHELTLCGRSQSRPDKHLGWGNKGGGAMRLAVSTSVLTGCGSKQVGHAVCMPCICVILETLYLNRPRGKVKLND